MLLAEFLERAGNGGAVNLLKIDGERPRRRWTVVVSSPHLEGRRGDFERLDRGLDFARKWPAHLTLRSPTTSRTATATGRLRGLLRCA